jgi:hypothetical protein
VSAPPAIASSDVARRAVPIVLREAFARVAGVDGAEAPGADEFLPAGARVFSSHTIESATHAAQTLGPQSAAQHTSALANKT